MIRLYKLRDYDFRLVIALIVLSTIGVLLVGSADASLQNRQLMGMILGLVLMVIVSLMDFSWILNFSWLMYAGNILLLLGVRLFGSDAGGVRHGEKSEPINLGFDEAKMLLVTCSSVVNFLLSKSKV